MQAFQSHQPYIGRLGTMRAYQAHQPHIGRFGTMQAFQSHQPYIGRLGTMTFALPSLPIPVLAQLLPLLLLLLLGACGSDTLRPRSNATLASMCPDGCPAGSSCRVNPTSTPEQPSFICIYHHSPYCAPCENDTDCIDPMLADHANLCLEHADGQGSYCATLCGPDAYCPEGARCSEHHVDNQTVPVCLPVDGVCECSDWAIEREASTSCYISNGEGRCLGVRTCTDEDGLTDCDAALPTAEICNDRDDSCDGAVDEDFPLKGTSCDGDDLDSCQDGVWICRSDSLVCTDNGDSFAERCNDRDDDCDSSVDEDFGHGGRYSYTDADGRAGLAKGQGCGVGACARGVVVCDADQLTLTCSTVGLAAIETCDGVDNDCNGTVDDVQSVPAASKQFGVCAGATKVCSGQHGWIEPNYAALPHYETIETSCDGLDNDCDGRTDEDLAPPPSPLQQGVCATSLMMCAGELGWVAPNYAALPGFESVEVSCDGRDNDCDGQRDEDLATPLAARQQGVCQGAVKTCGGSLGWLEPEYGRIADYEQVEESCDGLDNDCDGKVDNILAPPASLQQSGVCVGMVQICTGEDGWVEPDYAALLSNFEYREGSCDGQDNDCDGFVDNILTAPLNPNQNGACAGSRQVCSGSRGWGPSYGQVSGFGRPETPDALFADENCDGIDGDIANAVFVAPGAADNELCSLARPCGTLQHAMERATTLRKHDVYVRAGTYDEILAVEHSDLAIYGGYNDLWRRASHQTPGHTVTIVGGLDPLEQQYLTVRIRTAAITLADLQLDGPAASPVSGAAGQSSYVVHARDSDVTLLRVTVDQGNGADGAPGGSGTSAARANAGGGSDGGNADSWASTCDDSSRGPGGSGGANGACGDSGTLGDTRGGGGGDGGTMDSNCSFWVWEQDLAATSGGSGGDAALASAAYGRRGSGGSVCTRGGDGIRGRIANGDGGPGGASGEVTGAYWAGGIGGAGSLGLHGGGGGGGGGSGGCDDGNDDHGAGGGGGGAGGCRAPGVATGGQPGGGSFGVVSIDSSLHVMGTRFVRGVGGRGGDGGLGGTGQSGGVGARGGQGTSDTGEGGRGGEGGHGGHGGGGGGGAGGPSCGIYGVGSVVDTIDNQFTGGTPGDGGRGGASAPDAAVAERDGNPGADGARGELIEVVK